MIGDSEIVIAAGPGRFRHHFQCIDAIGAIGVRMQNAAQILVRNQLRQILLNRESDLVLALAQLGFDEGEAECRVYLFLGSGDDLAGTMQSRRVQHEAFPRCQRCQLFKMRPRPGRMQ